MSNNALFEIAAFFEAVAPDLSSGEFLEIRPKYVDGGWNQEFFSNYEDAATRAQELTTVADVYFAPAIRGRKSGTEEDVSRTSTIWMDIDCRSDDDRKDVRDRLKDIPLRPSMMVRSGGGYHPYWTLNEPITSEDNLDRAKSVMRRLARALGGDNVFDLSRILRVPRTLNHKYNPPLPVQIVFPMDCTDLSGIVNRYSLEDLEEMAQSLAPTEPDNPSNNSVLLTDSRITEGSRNTTLTKFGGFMRRVDFSEESIRAALLIENQKLCDPPLEDSEVSTIARSLARYEPSLDPRDLAPRLPLSVPTFPAHVLPERLENFIREAAASVVCPVEFIAVPMLVNLGTAIGNSRRVRLKQGWTEGASLYAAVVADPGAKKSPAFNLALRPAYDVQAQYARAYQDAMEDYRREYAEAKEAGQPLPTPPIQQRTTVDDITIESLTLRLNENPRGIHCANDELTGFMRRMDQYKGGAGSDRQKYLSMWSNAQVSVDRKGDREPILLRYPFLGISGSIQPGLLREIKNDRDDGMVDRFLLSYPAPMASRWTEDEISESATAGYSEIYENLRSLEMLTDADGNPSPRYITPTPDAMIVFIETIDGLREEMERPGFSDYLKGPWSKLEGYLARLALIVGTVRTSEQPEGFMTEFDTITAADMEAAVQLLEYFKANARKVHMTLHGAQPQVILEAEIASWLNGQGGTWDGQVNDLFELLKEANVSNLPGGSGPLGKLLNKLRDSGDYIVVEEFNDMSVRKIRLSLKPGWFDGVSG